MSGSAIGDVIDALVTIAGTVIDPDAVFDGPAMDPGRAPVEIHIGAQLDETGAPAGETDLTWAWLGHTQHDENGAVACIITAWGGDREFKPIRDVALTALDGLVAAIKDDPSLDGACLYVSGISLGSLHQQVDQDGLRVYLTPTIRYRARP